MRPLESQLSANIFLHVPPLGQKQKQQQQQPWATQTLGRRKPGRKLVFFIPGNPGLIGYYRPFLALVVQGLRGGREDESGDGRVEGAEAVVAGFSLGGFDVDEIINDDDDDDAEEGKPWRNDGNVRKGGKGVQQEEEEEEVGGGGGGGSAHDDKGHEDGDRSDEEDTIPVQRFRVPAGEDKELLLCPPSFSPGSFHDERHEKRRERHPTTQRQRKVYTLREQIVLTYARVEYLVQRLQDRKSPSTHISEQEPVQVVLIGHSVGAYIALELVRLWHERHHHRQQHQHISLDTAANPSEKGGGDDDDMSTLATDSSESGTKIPPASSWAISTCILLTPTIQDIHLSPSGRVATPALTYLPFLPSLAHTLLHTVLLKLLPSMWFAALVSRLTGMRAGSHGFETTMAFLQSKRGVKQALFMARGEMDEIRCDTWGQEVWGASHNHSHSDSWNAEDERGASTTSPRLFFWFAKKDHWVADVTKEAIFQRKPANVGVQRDRLARHRTNMELSETEEEDFMEDQAGSTTRQAPRFRILETERLVHAWCLDQSEFVARRVSGWLREVLDAGGCMLHDGRPSYYQY
ncbi:hypothetical protein AYO21_11239 [Fonsecaea monophora]|uniref:Uncharacterized protein n=1 Tax=Fonsecaea monophora TaxID=254056 RepID=A0A177ERE9_9EURO|nr:hypothetical protein AYO21_11239 [Fonsecaea monophora]KAH0846477.1 hypothetical protein FOPE_11541 [Fonsecaea pedrosoi]OAG34594.1 hypothetical protein AYO21_11239 [Fonsecaea monophora]